MKHTDFQSLGDDLVNPHILQMRNLNPIEESRGPCEAGGFSINVPLDSTHFLYFTFLTDF